MPKPHRRQVNSSRDGTAFDRNEDVTIRVQKVDGATQKGAIKIRFPAAIFRVDCIFYALIDTFFLLPRPHLVSQSARLANSKAKIKSSRRFITELKFNVASEPKLGRGGERGAEQFSTTFFQFITFKGRRGEEREKAKRDRTVKNPSEAFNLLLQQNFIPPGEL
jgi:hypothetical protein